jgi:hypothetical protein
MRHILIPALLLSLAAAPACAADAAVSPAPPPPSANPQAQARMQALIDHTPKAAAAFRADAHGRVVHIQSGLKCGPGVEPIALVGLYIAPIGAPGDDVGCDWRGGDAKISAFVTRLGATRIADYTRDAIAALKQRYPDAGEPVPVFAVGNPALGKPTVAAFPITLQGRPYITSICVAEERGWAVKVRATYPPDMRQAALAAATICGFARQDIHDFAPNDGE